MTSTEWDKTTCCWPTRQRSQAFIQVKFGAQRGPDGVFLGIDARPTSVKTASAYSLRRLGTDYVDLYQTGLDPAVPVEDTGVNSARHSQIDFG